MKNFLRRDSPQPSPRSRTSLTLPPLSLLSPHAPPVTGEALAPVIERQAVTWEDDLGIHEVVQAMSTDRRYAAFIRQTLTALPMAVEVIRWRQGIFADLLANPPLVAAVETLLPVFTGMRQGTAQLGGRRRSLLVETADRLAELELYLEIVERLAAALAAASLTSPALLTLRDNLLHLMREPEFHRLRVELPAMREPLQQLRSLTIAINLDAQLRPESAALVSVNAHPINEPATLLDRLIGSRIEVEDESAIAPLYQFPKDPDLRPMDALFQDVDRLMNAVAGPVARSLARYVGISSKPLLALENEFAFFSSAVSLTRRLMAQGIHVCQPQIVPPEQRVIQIDGLHSLLLCLHAPPVPVPGQADFGDDGRIALLTGPNSGGKTTYLRSVGLAQVLAQAGLSIPAQQAVISPVDRILTHFPALETRQEGRLAEEAVRLRDLFTQATAHSLILLNETFSSTAASEAVYLAQDILSAMCVIGVRAIFATHLTDLVERITEIETSAEQQSGQRRSGVFSLVAGVRLEANGAAAVTYEIRRGKPHGRSYASEIARRYGISLDQLVTRADDSL